ncbi:MAG TPA: hypothetical protein VGG32_08715 [Thermoplasmata archaeon]
MISVPDRTPVRKVREARPPEFTTCPWCHLPNDPVCHPPGLWDRHIAFVAHEVADRILGVRP